LYTTKAFIVLDADGKRLAAKYYSFEWPSMEKQLVFEKALFTKAQVNPSGSSCFPQRWRNAMNAH
jgi:hypothetical protein